jgi:protoporphyrinogen oxidase
VENLWTEILPNDMLERPRSSRVFYKGRFYSYPLKLLEALWKLGVVESGLCMLSYLHAQARPIRDPRSFEDWVSNQFGRRLFRIFFKTYTEKVWGMDCKEISADWAAQRIQGLSLWSVTKNGLWPARRTGQRPPVIKTLIDSFRYPRRGPGMMWEACASRVKQMGGDIRMGQRVKACSWDGSMDQWKVQCTAGNGQRSEIVADHVICSAPLRQLAESLRPALPEDAIRAAGSLKYRDFLTVALIAKDRKQLSDNWIYIHDPAVKVGRIQNYKAWSPEMVSDPAYCYGLEYFCFEGYGLWQSSDEDLIALAKRELVAIGLASLDDITDGCVVRQAKAYPVYDDDYAENVQCVRQVIEADYPNLHLVGRNGMHKYNNQDHAMMTACSRRPIFLRAKTSTTSGWSTRTRSITRQARPESAWKRAECGWSHPATGTEKSLTRAEPCHHLNECRDSIWFSLTRAVGTARPRTRCARSLRNSSGRGKCALSTCRSCWIPWMSSAVSPASACKTSTT